MGDKGGFRKGSCFSRVHAVERLWRRLRQRPNLGNVGQGDRRPLNEADCLWERLPWRSWKGSHLGTGGQGMRPLRSRFRREKIRKDRGITRREIPRREDPSRRNYVTGYPLNGIAGLDSNGKIIRRDSIRGIAGLDSTGKIIRDDSIRGIAGLDSTGRTIRGDSIRGIAGLDSTGKTIRGDSGH